MSGAPFAHPAREKSEPPCDEATRAASGPARASRTTLVIIMLLGVLVLRSPASHAVDTTQLSDPALQSRYLALTHELRCMQCQNEAIADSPVGLAADMRRQVREMLLAGKSDDDVRNFMVARYGDFILFRPRFTARTAWLWFAPGVLLVIGVIVAIRVLRQRSALLSQDTEPVEEELRAP